MTFSRASFGAETLQAAATWSRIRPGNSYPSSLSWYSSISIRSACLEISALVSTRAVLLARISR